MDKSNFEEDVVVTMIPPISIWKIDFSSQPIDCNNIDKSNKEWFEKHHKEKKI